jgi:translation initiation factor 1
MKGGYVHIRIQQRAGKKSITTVQGLAPDLDLKKILKALKKTYNTNGTIIQDEEAGDVLQLAGDQRKNVSNFLTMTHICEENQIKIHGF